MKKLVVLLMLAGLFVGAAIASDEGGQKVKKQDAATSQKQMRRRRPGTLPMPQRGIDRQQRQRQMLASRAHLHQQTIEELEKIKAIAQEEGAPRTVEAIQKMIDKKNEEYKKRVAVFTRMQRERAGQIQQRLAKPDIKEPKTGKTAPKKNSIE